MSALRVTPLEITDQERFLYVFPCRVVHSDSLDITPWADRAEPLPKRELRWDLKHEYSPFVSPRNEISTEIELAVANILAHYSCHLTVPMLGDITTLTMLFEFGHDEFIPTPEMHTMLLIMIVWIEASAQQQFIGDLHGLQNHAKAMSFGNSKTRQLVSRIADIWLQKRSATISPSRPIGIPLARIGAMKDHNHFRREDVQQRRRIMNIDDGQVTLRQKLCRFFLEKFATESSTPLAKRMTEFIFGTSVPRFRLNDRWIVTDLLLTRSRELNRTSELRSISNDIAPILNTVLRWRYPLIDLRRGCGAQLCTLAEKRQSIDGSVAITTALCVVAAGTPSILLDLEESRKKHAIPECMRVLCSHIQKASTENMNELWPNEEAMPAFRFHFDAIAQAVPHCDPSEIGVLKFGEEWDCGARLKCDRIMRLPLQQGFVLGDGIISIARSSIKSLLTPPPAVDIEALMSILANAKPKCKREAMESTELDRSVSHVLRSLLPHHPDARRKIGCGISSFSAGWCTDKKGPFFSFIVHRVCGTHEPFGVLKCLAPHRCAATGAPEQSTKLHRVE